MLRLILLLLSLFWSFYFTYAQQITGRIIDSQTKESIPFATIRVGEADLISNQEGYFTFLPDNNSETVVISFIGYNSQQLSVSQLRQNSIIALVPVIYDIGEIYVTNEKPNADTIVNRAKKGLKTLYKSTNLKQTIFTRKSTEFKPKTAEVKIKKSTEFSKNELKKLNEELAGFTSGLVNYPPQQFTDRLVNYYTSTKKINDKFASVSKVEVIKAVKLHDRNRSTHLDDLEKTAANLMLKYVDTTKFYRIKSGLFGSRDTISFSEEYNNKSKNKYAKQQSPENKKNSEIKSSITISRSTLWNSETSEFIHKTDIYTYTFVETTYLDGELVYVIDFKPKKKKAKYSGRLYINADDYAILRADYDLAEGKNLYSFNLKLILGVKSAQNISRGTFIYKKVSDSDMYYLYYASKEWGQYFYINRPLKLIEITKNRKERDVVAFDIKVEGNMIDKSEYLNTSIQSVTSEEVEKIKEKDFNYEIQSEYNPNIWKGYNIIEPLEEMKKFKVLEE
ncbi:MAG: carboxypeptidase-like regulatory domain-containing protein [Flavobacteriaceae bacterium]